MGFHWKSVRLATHSPTHQSTGRLKRASYLNVGRNEEWLLRSTPTDTAGFLALVHELTALVQNGRGVAVHCRAGIGRSGLAAACVLLRLGIPALEVFGMLSQARRLPVPDTESQIEWFHSVAVPRLA
ncbi:protein-tyrosine phosphatase family protein [Duganella sp. Root1480D1]|uniref:protein-tyrosine phosphatase family protein n=1 Tax=Duganella sp. Root1480D1 TaxID=1736471 RepID=UPI0009EC465C